MPIFKNAANPASTANIKAIPKNIPQSSSKVLNPSKTVKEPTILVPSFIVSLSQSLITFIINHSSSLHNITSFEIDELHLLIITFLGISSYYTHKYRRESKSQKLKLSEYIQSSKLHNFSTIANIDDNNLKRIECLYYKNELQMYDIDTLTRTELRTFIDGILGQCNILSALSIKILTEFVNYLKQNDFNKLHRIQAKKLLTLNNTNKNVNKRKIAMEFRNIKYEINENYDIHESKIEDFEAYFDDKASEEYLIKYRQEEFKRTEKEILNEIKELNNKKNHQINKDKLFKNDPSNINGNNDDEKDLEDDDINTTTATPGGPDDRSAAGSPVKQIRRTEMLNIAMLNDYKYFSKMADNLPIQQIDFSSKQVSPYNVTKEVEKMKIEMYLKDTNEKRQERYRKIGIFTAIVVSTGFSYWYSRYYNGRSPAQYIRDTKTKFYSYF